LSAAEGLFGLAPQLIRRDHEYALRVLVWHVKDLEDSAGRSLADLAARVSDRRQVFPASAKDFLHLLLGDAVAVNVVLAGVGVKVIADVHARPFIGGDRRARSRPGRYGFPFPLTNIFLPEGLRRKPFPGGVGDEPLAKPPIPSVVGRLGRIHRIFQLILTLMLNPLATAAHGWYHRRVEFIAQPPPQRQVCMRPFAAACLALALTLPSPADPDARTDAQGDPLPQGALARLGTSRFRAAPENPTACLSPDGKLVAVPGPGKMVRLLDAADGAEVRSFEIDPAVPADMAFSPDGGVLATYWYDDVLHLWDAANGKALARIEVKYNGVASFAFSGDGKRVAVTTEKFGDNRAVRVYEVPGGKEVATFELAQDPRVGAALSGDGKRLATWAVTGPADRDGADREKLFQTVRVWDVDAGKELRRVETDRGAVGAAALTADGTRLVTAAGPAGDAQIWDAAEGKLLHTFKGGGAAVVSLWLSPDGKAVYAAGADGSLRGLDPDSGRALQTAAPPAAPPAGRPENLVFPAGGPALACGLDGQGVVVWEVASGKARDLGPGHTGAVVAAAFAPDGKTLYSAGRDGRAVQWDAAAGKERRRTNLALAKDDVLRNPELGKALFSPGGKYLLVGAVIAQAVLDPETGRRACAFTNWEGFGCIAGGEPPLPAGFSADGSLLAAGVRSDDGPQVVVVETKTGREVCRLKGVEGAAVVGALALSPDGRRVAACCPRGAPGHGGSDVMVWEVGADRGPRVLKQLPAEPDGRLDALEFSPDGRLLAAADTWGGLAVWDASTGRTWWERPKAAKVTARPVFSPDGRTLAVATFDHAAAVAHVRLWDVAAGRVRREFVGHTAPVSTLAFSPDGRVLASGAGDTTLLLWDASGVALPDAALRKALKPDELDSLWADLASDNAGVVEKAIRQLAYAPADAVPFLTKQVRPVAANTLDADALARKVAALDSDDFDDREKAEKELAEIGKDAAPALRRALEGDPPEELKRRARRLLDRLESPDPRGAALRPRRAAEALERAGTPEAVQLLEALAKGRADADLTEDARAALRRLKARAAPAP
jgi:WD40 repeat protein